MEKQRKLKVPSKAMTTEAVCLEISQYLPGIVDGDIPREAAAHVEKCLRCQAEASRYRRIARELEKLAELKAEPPVDLVQPVLSALQEQAARRSRFKIAALGIGLGSAVVALGTVAGIALRIRHRVPVPRLANAG